MREDLEQSIEEDVEEQTRERKRESAVRVASNTSEDILRIANDKTKNDEDEDEDDDGGDMPIDPNASVPWKAALWCRKICRAITSNWAFKLLVLLAILFVGVEVGVQTAYDSSFFDYADTTITVIFVVEAVLLFGAEMPYCWRYLFPSLVPPQVHWWNGFDAVVVVLCLIQINEAAIIRLFRLLRLVKLVKVVPALRILLVALFASNASILYILLMLALLFYIFGILGLLLFQSTGSPYFSSLGSTLVTLFTLATGSSWNKVFKPIIFDDCTADDGNCSSFSENATWALIYFPVFYMLSAMVLLNLIVGVIIQVMEKVTTEDQKTQSDLKEEMEEAKRLQADKERNELNNPDEQQSTSGSNDSKKKKRKGPADAMAILTTAYRKVKNRLSQTRVGKIIVKISAAFEVTVHEEETLRDRANRELIRSIESSNETFELIKIMVEWMEKDRKERELLDEIQKKRIEARHVAAGSVFRRYYIRVGNVCATITEHKYFPIFNLMSIILASILTGIDASVDSDDPRQETVTRLGDFVTALFTIEIILKIVAQRLKPWLFFVYTVRPLSLEWWNLFDVLVVTFGFLQIHEVSVIRLLRLLRTLRLIRVFPFMRALLNGLLKSLSSITYVFILLLFEFYMFGVLGISLFGGNDPVHFGNLGLAMVTLMRCTTSDDWDEVLYVSYYGCDDPINDGYPKDLCTSPHAYGIVAIIFFVMFMLLSSMVLLNLVIGVINNNMEQTTNEMHNEKKVKWLRSLLPNPDCRFTPHSDHTKNLSDLLKKSRAHIGRTFDLYVLEAAKDESTLIGTDIAEISHTCQDGLHPHGESLFVSTAVRTQSEKGKVVVVSPTFAQIRRLSASLPPPAPSEVSWNLRTSDNDDEENGVDRKIYSRTNSSRGGSFIVSGNGVIGNNKVSSSGSSSSSSSASSADDGQNHLDRRKNGYGNGMANNNNNNGNDDDAHEYDQGGGVSSARGDGRGGGGDDDFDLNSSPEKQGDIHGNKSGGKHHHHRHHHHNHHLSMNGKRAVVNGNNHSFDQNSEKGSVKSVEPVPLPSSAALAASSVVAKANASGSNGPIRLPLVRVVQNPIIQENGDISPEINSRVVSVVPKLQIDDHQNPHLPVQRSNSSTLQTPRLSLGLADSVECTPRGKASGLKFESREGAGGMDESGGSSKRKPRSSIVSFALDPRLVARQLERKARKKEELIDSPPLAKTSDKRGKWSKQQRYRHHGGEENDEEYPVQAIVVRAGEDTNESSTNSDDQDVRVIRQVTYTNVGKGNLRNHHIYEEEDALEEQQQQQQQQDEELVLQRKQERREKQKADKKRRDTPRFSHSNHGNDYDDEEEEEVVTPAVLDYPCQVDHDYDDDNDEDVMFTPSGHQRAHLGRTSNHRRNHNNSSSNNIRDDEDDDDAESLVIDEEEEHVVVTAEPGSDAFWSENRPNEERLVYDDDAADDDDLEQWNHNNNNNDGDYDPEGDEEEQYSRQYSSRIHRAHKHKRHQEDQQEEQYDDYYNNDADNVDEEYTQQPAAVHTADLTHPSDEWHDHEYGEDRDATTWEEDRRQSQQPQQQIRDSFEYPQEDILRRRFSPRTSIFNQSNSAPPDETPNAQYVGSSWGGGADSSYNKKKEKAKRSSLGTSPPDGIELSTIAYLPSHIPSDDAGNSNDGGRGNTTSRNNNNNTNSSKNSGNNKHLHRRHRASMNRSGNNTFEFFDATNNNGSSSSGDWNVADEAEEEMIDLDHSGGGVEMAGNEFPPPNNNNNSNNNNTSSAKYSSSSAGEDSDISWKKSSSRPRSYRRKTLSSALNANLRTWDESNNNNSDDDQLGDGSGGGDSSRLRRMRRPQSVSAATAAASSGLALPPATRRRSLELMHSPLSATMTC